jgi:ammonium transporter, Amt family
MPDIPLACPARLAARADETRPMVLVVDDESADRELHCLALHSWGLRAIAAGDGWEALVCARTLRPALVIADVRMPGLDGWGLLRRLRAAPETADIPVLLVTGHDESWRPHASAAEGAVGVLRKPIDLDALRRATTALVERTVPDR